MSGQFVNKVFSPHFSLKLNGADVAHRALQILVAHQRYDREGRAIKVLFPFRQAVWKRVLDVMNASTVFEFMNR